MTNKRLAFEFTIVLSAADDAVNTITNDLSSITVTVDSATVLSNNMNNCLTV